MFQFLGYNFYSDGDCLNPSMGVVNNIRKIRISNGVFDHFNVTSNTNTPFTTEQPSWDYDTIINADFNGHLDGGNIEGALKQLSSVRIKRRKKGEFNWLTLEERPIKTIEDLTFVIEDKINANGVEYEYAFVPVLNQSEGNYTIESILSEFKGVFLSDSDNIFRFLYDVNYGNQQQVQQVGTFEPLGKKYPILVSNGSLNYKTGNVSFTMLNDNYEETHKIDTEAIVVKKKKFLEFLTNHKAKVLKDWNGNMWLVGIVENPQVTYLNGSGMGIPQISFSWTEIGDANSQEDLYINGVLNIPE